MTQITYSKPLVGIVLFISLMANVFMGGMLVGKHKYGLGDGAGFRAGKFIEAFRDLSPETREKAKTAVKDGWPVIKERLEAVREKRDAVKKIVLQKEYKDEDLDKAFAAVREEVNKLMDEGQKLGKSVLKNLTPEEREQFIRKLPSPPAE